MKPAILIPAKKLNEAKSRLAPALNSEQRARLAMDMLLNVLRAAGQCPRIERRVVVTADEDVLSLAISEGAEVFVENRLGLNAALSEATEWLIGQGVSALLVLMSDLPFLATEDVEGILELAGEDRGIVLAPSHDGLGTNALFTRPPGLIPYSFAGPSLDRFLASARAARVPTRVYRSPSVAHDIDLVAGLNETDLFPWDAANRAIYLRLGDNPGHAPAPPAFLRRSDP